MTDMRSVAPTGSTVRASALLLAVGAMAVGLGTIIAFSPWLVVTVIALGCLAVAVWNRPWIAAVMVIAVTPLVAGIDRGRLLPVLRPNEALVLVLAAILAGATLYKALRTGSFAVRLHRVEWALIAMATAASVIPLIWMVIRGVQPSGDDVSYALVLWKYLAVYALVRAAVRSDKEVMWCLVASVSAAVVVGLVGMLQALDLAGVREFLKDWYVPNGNVDALANPRGGSTLALPAATADLLVFNLAIVLGMWSLGLRHRLLMTLAGAVCVLGVFAAGEFSSLLGLLVGTVAAVFALRRADLLRHAPETLLIAAVVMWPVMSQRLAGFQTVHGMPVSWSTRLSNLQDYFWPELFSGANVLLGVRPSARVVVSSQGTGYVWIESGYTWLLWGGGIPLLLSFAYFAYVAGAHALRRCRPLVSWSGVAGAATFAAVTVVVVLMVFDPHLTYRGSADSLFSLLALTMVGHGFRERPPWRLANGARWPMEEVRGTIP
jgi:hypothetical protein